MRRRLPGTAWPSRAKERSQSRRRMPPTAVPGKRLPGRFWSATRCLAAEAFLFRLAASYLLLAPEGVEKSFEHETFPQRVNRLRKNSSRGQGTEDPGLKPLTFATIFRRG